MSNDPIITPFYFVRHAAVVKESGYLPPHDSPIINQNYDLANLLAILPQKADWHISPLLRTCQTADLLCTTLNPLSKKVDTALVEQNFGKWAGQPVADVWKELENKPRHNWSYMPANRLPPEGESFVQQCERISNWCSACEQEIYIAPQIIISHAGTMRAMLAHMLSITPDHALSFTVPNLGCLEVHMMDAGHARANVGGSWQVKSLP